MSKRLERTDEKLAEGKECDKKKARRTEGAHEQNAKWFREARKWRL